jgi:hypothetical protein
MRCCFTANSGTHGQAVQRIQRPRPDLDLDENGALEFHPHRLALWIGTDKRV